MEDRGRRIDEYETRVSYGVSETLSTHTHARDRECVSATKRKRHLPQTLMLGTTEPQTLSFL